MTARRYTTKPHPIEPQQTCADCAHSYDWHERGWNGKPFLCRCKFYTDGRFCRFLNEPQCKHFKPKDDAAHQ